jgi:hypothetical protein
MCMYMYVYVCMYVYIYIYIYIYPLFWGFEPRASHLLQVLYHLSHIHLLLYS